MADKSLHFRNRTVTCLLSDEEYLRLRTMCRTLRVPVREVLMVGVRRCERTYAEELRRQRQLDED